MIFLNLANSADPYEMHHHVAFCMGLYRLPKYPFRDFQNAKNAQGLFQSPMIAYQAWLEGDLNLV